MLVSMTLIASVQTEFHKLNLSCNCAYSVFSVVGLEYVSNVVCPDLENTHMKSLSITIKKTTDVLIA